MNTLKSGLEFFINKVEESKIIKFHMFDYDRCVIGQTVGWRSDQWDDEDEQSTLEKYFGIKTEDEYALFAEDRYLGYTDEQWAVIRLFTSDIGRVISRKDWLKLAKNQLKKLK